MPLPSLYYLPTCPFCRSVLMLVRQLGLQLQLHPVDLSKKEHMTPEFLAMNPAHTVPVLKDDDVTLSESRAIMGYLVDRYAAADDSLYPRDTVKRALVNKWLFYVSGSLVPSARLVYKPLYAGLPVMDDARQQFDETLSIVDKMLAAAGNGFAIGTSLTIADIDLLIGIDQSVILADVDLSKHENVSQWFKRMTTESLSCYEEISGSVVRGLKQQLQAEQSK